MGKSIIPSTLVDHVATINITTKEPLEQLGKINVRPNPIVLELANHFTICPEGIV